MSGRGERPRAVGLSNFRGARVVLVHRDDAAARKLKRQLARLGIDCIGAWPRLEALPEDTAFVFFDGDSCYDGVFPWAPGAAPLPLIALMGSEAPGRLEWVLAQGIAAHLVKPIQATGVFSALVIAQHSFERDSQRAREASALAERQRRRPDATKTVSTAVAALMRLAGLEEEAAYACLRSAAMQRRVSIEELCDSADTTTLRRIARGRGARLGRA